MTGRMKEIQKKISLAAQVDDWDLLTELFNGMLTEIRHNLNNLLSGCTQTTAMIAKVALDLFSLELSERLGPAEIRFVEGAKADILSSAGGEEK